MHYRTLLTAETLQAHLHDSNLVVVDCRFSASALLPAPPGDALHEEHRAAGRKAFREVHIPGAIYAHLDDDLSGPKTPTSGRHPLPDSRVLVATFSRWGIDKHTQVIAYDSDNGSMAAARLWWLLRWLGHEHVAVLDGGMRAWLAAGLATSHSEFTPAPREFVANINNSLQSSAADVLARINSAEWRVIDARAPERFAGKVEPVDPVAGHVPGALNHPFARNLDEQGRWLDAATLKQRYEAVLGPVSADHTIMMCGSGVTAAHNLLAMEVAGLHGARLYAGSWSEWITDPARPVARN